MIAYPNVPLKKFPSCQSLFLHAGSHHFQFLPRDLAAATSRDPAARRTLAGLIRDACINVRLKFSPVLRRLMSQWTNHDG